MFFKLSIVSVPCARLQVEKTQRLLGIAKLTVVDWDAVLEHWLLLVLGALIVWNFSIWLRITSGMLGLQVEWLNQILHIQHMLCKPTTTYS